MKETLNTDARRATRKKIFVNRAGWAPTDTRYIRLRTQPENNLRDNGGKSLEEYPRNELGVISQQIMLNNQGIDADQQKKVTPQGNDRWFPDREGRQVPGSNLPEVSQPTD